MLYHTWAVPIHTAMYAMCLWIPGHFARCFASFMGCRSCVGQLPQLVCRLPGDLACAGAANAVYTTDNNYYQWPCLPLHLPQVQRLHYCCFLAKDVARVLMLTEHSISDVTTQCVPMHWFNPLTASCSCVPCNLPLGTVAANKRIPL